MKSATIFQTVHREQGGKWGKESGRKRKGGKSIQKRFFCWECEGEKEKREKNRGQNIGEIKKWKEILPRQTFKMVVFLIPHSFSLANSLWDNPKDNKKRETTPSQLTIKVTILL